MEKERLVRPDPKKMEMDMSTRLTAEERGAMETQLRTIDLNCIKFCKADEKGKQIVLQDVTSL